ncbi:MAG: hypothetical protein P4M07_15810 [Xanthobacteraceae bacterium]|nr:hypothetical protein [Xanthobacteraceae bacterium]
MNPPVDITRYFVWAAVVMVGAVLAMVDWRWIRRPALGLLLLAGVVGGAVLTYLSPFDFVTGGYYMVGVIISAGSALALAGYGVVVIGWFAARCVSPRPPAG